MSNIIIEPKQKQKELIKEFQAGKLAKKYYNKLIFYKTNGGFRNTCNFFGENIAPGSLGVLENKFLKDFLDKNKIVYVDNNPPDGQEPRDFFTTDGLKGDPINGPGATFYFFMRGDVLQSMNPGLLSTKTASKLNSPGTTVAGNLPKGISTSNISIVSGLTGVDKRFVVYKIADLKLMSYVASRVMQLLKQKIDYYNITLDRPINLNYLATQIRSLNDAVVGIVNDYTTSGGKVNADIANDYVKIEFSLDDYKFEKIFLSKRADAAAGSGGLAQLPADRPGSLSVLLVDSTTSTPSYFNDSTLNSLVFNLSKIYNRYNLNFQLNEKATAPQGGPVNSSVFVNADETKMFLNKYLFPRSSIVVNEVTQALIESFILGDVRLLDDEYYKNYFPTGERFNDAFKDQMQQEMSKQYEAIGDLLGDSFIAGKFQEINSVEDYYEQLLNYIDVDSLISLSVKCLLKLIPVDELLDIICKDILKAFDDHKEAIVQGLEEMDDGIAKDLAKELGDIYFNKILDPQVKWGEDIISRSIQNTTDILKDADQSYSWTTGPLMKSFISRMLISYEAVIDAVGASSGLSPAQLNDQLGKSLESTFGRSTIDDRIKSLIDRRDKLVDNQNVQNDKNKVFTDIPGQTPPENLVNLDKYYNTQIGSLTSQISSLTAAKNNGEDQAFIYRSLMEDIIPRLIIVCPHLTQAEKAEVKSSYAANQLFGSLGSPGTLAGNESIAETINNLNNISGQIYSNLKSGVAVPQDYLNSDGTAFLFPENYMAQDLQSRKNIFDINLIKFKQIIATLEELQKRDTSPWITLKKFEEFGVETFDEYINEIFSAEDGTKRYYLCLAIYGTVPAVIYFIYQLFRDAKEVGEFFEDNAASVGKAFKRKMQMFLRTDYPVRDIFEELLEQFKQIGLNLARDLILSGIFYTIGKITEFCSEEELVNTPFDPFGAIDLSNFIIDSKSKTGGKIGSIDNSKSYKEAKKIDDTITPDIYKQILDLISANFSIRQICSMIDQTAGPRLYEAAIELISELSFLQDTDFLTYYGNIQGIKELFSFINKDFDFSFCAEAAKDFNDQKSKLFEICMGLDETTLADVFSNGIDPDGVKDALAANKALKTLILGNLIPDINNLFKENRPLDPCEDGSAKLTELEISNAKILADSVFGNLDTLFEGDISNYKIIFEDIEKGIDGFRDVQPGTFVSTEQFIEDNLDSLTEIQKSRNIVGSKVYTSYLEAFNNNQIRFQGQSALTGPGLVFNFESEPDNFNIKRGINFVYSSAGNITDFAYHIQNVDEDATEEADAGGSVFTLASYKENQYFESGETAQEILFKYDTGVINQPKYNEIVKQKVCELSLKNDFYSKIINGMFFDLALDTFKLGLYERENWEKLNLNKNINSITSAGGTESTCFLGFMNKSAFIDQVVKLSQRLVCLSPNSATETPINVAVVKVATDAFIRSITIKEFLKSIFVFSVFPRGFGFFNSNAPKSIYEQILRSEIINSLNQRFESDYYKFEDFYDQILKKFITEITRILFQNEALTDEFALQFEIDSQIAFIKSEFSSLFANTFSEEEILFDKSEYQLLAENASEASSEFEIISDEAAPPPIKKADRIDQVDALINDYLPINDGKTKISFKGNISTYPLAVVGEQNSFNYFLAAASDLAPELNYNFTATDKQPGIETIPKDGLILEKYIEIKPKTNFFSDPQLKQLIETFLLFLGKYVEPGIGTDNYKKKLKMFLYDTRLFMLFPQIIEFIDNLDNEDASSPIFQYTNLNPDVGFDLMYWFFKYNFEDNFFANLDNLNWYTSFSKSSLFGFVDMSVFGKTYLSDVESLLGRFTYPVDNDSLNILQSKDIFDIQNELLDTETTNQLNNLTIDTLFINNPNSHYVNPELNSRTGEFFQLIRNENIFMQDLKALLEGSLLEQKPLFNISTTIDNVIYVKGRNFFQWLYSQKISDIYEFNTVTRIETKIADLTGQISAEFYNSVFENTAPTPLLGPLTAYTKQKTLIEEKIGHERKSSTLQLPFFELKQPIKQELTWFDFFIKIDKAGYYFDENFYNIDGLDASVILNTNNINEFVFSNNKNDIYSYFYKLKSYSNFSKSSVNTIEKVSYLNNIWWNVGKSLDDPFAGSEFLSLTDILDALFIDGHQNKELISNALTEASLKSFQSIADQFIGEPSFGSLGTVTDDNDLGPISSQNQIKYPLFLSKNIPESNQFLTRQEYNILVKAHLQKIFDVSGEAAGSSFLDNGDWATGIRPYIQLKWEYNFGWAEYNDDDVEKIGYKLNEKFKPAKFEDQFVFPYSDPLPYSPTGPNRKYAMDGTILGDGYSFGAGDPENHLGYRKALVESIPGVGGLSEFYFLQFPIKYRAIRGGLAVNKDLVPVFIDNKMNIFDLFIIMLYAGQENRETFEKLLKSVFLKEQTTIISLLHKIFVETNYPKMETNFNPSIKNSLNILLSAAAAANGDIYHPTRAKDVVTLDEIGEAAGQIGLGLLKGFLSAFANIVDPTWQTPWLLPGPLTPFGIAAKLINQDKDGDEQGPVEEQKQPPLAPCLDKIGQQSKFFENYLQQYQGSESGAVNLDLINQIVQSSNFGGNETNIISPDLINTLINSYQSGNEDEEDS